MKKFFPLLLFFCTCVTNCKPIARQEPTSAVEMATAVAVFKQLMDNKYYWGARIFIAKNIENKEGLVKGVLHSYHKEGADNLQSLNNFLRSYTHSSTAIVINRDIENLFGKIAISERNQDVVALLAQAEKRIDNIKDLYMQRRRVQMTAAGQGSKDFRPLSVSAINDYKNWSGKVDKNMFFSLRKYLYRTPADADTWPTSIRDGVLRVRDSLEKFTP